MENLDAWRDFNVAMVGATSALAGLVIVAASVNITAIIKAATLTARLAAGIASLLMGLTASAIALWPDLSLPGFGIGVIIVAVVSAIFPVAATARLATSPAAQGSARRAVTIVLAWLPTVAYLVGGSVLLAGLAVGAGIVAAGTLLAIVSAVIVSWVALVEVLR
ncbi:hypothetical protein [Microbacterium aurantiacum]|uniref:Modulator of FtsH protease n=1 Tax=Microbacterium aurantiacum TaxID=162393 RepID=A0A0M8MNX5_9MICO|nr:hypothetical protein [Microbacterium chocolatum]ANG86216.1 hypothetical protein A8L33_13350 [Microbacterium chocolatum]KOS10880.1 hypothetical protein XI38_08805 [Microbacterium chocolatum]